MTRVRRTAFLCVAMIACSLAFAACGGGSSQDPEPRSGPPRSFLLGFSSLPRELNADAYAEAFDFAGDHGEIVLIQRHVPWDEFAPGRSVSGDTAESTSSERDAAREKGLKLFFAIDPTDGATGRDRLVNLPEEMAGRRFDDVDVRAAFLSYAEYVAVNYRPAYLAIGVEMNLYYEKNKDDWENFRSLYAEAYAAVKEASPETQITVTLQYEDLQGLLPRDDKHVADWQLVRAFDPIDFVAISTYPSFYFSDPAAIPANYYSQLTAFTDKPIAIAEMGYASSGGQQDANSGTEEQQASYLDRAIEEAQKLPLAFAVWFAIWDPAYAADSGFEAFQSIGLLRTDGTEKPAWERWDAAARRPYREP